MSKLDKQLRRAEQLGVSSEVASLLKHYLDAVQNAADDYRGFHWGERSEHVSMCEHPLVEPVMHKLGDLVEVTYEASKAGELCHWVHPFENPRPVLAYGDSGNLWILGGRYTVNRRGIVG